MNGRRLPLSRVLVAFILGIPALAWSQQPSHPVLDEPGFRQNRDYFSEMPFEHIDTLTGSLILKFTDLVLPANAGRELRFERTYNSKTRGWKFGLVGIPLHISNGPPPIEVTHPQDGAPALHMSDGGIRWFEFPNKAVSSEFWLFDRTGVMRRLFLPNGDTCDFEDDSQSMLRVRSCTDAFNNETEFEWSLASSPPHLLITQDLGSVSRLITVTFPEGISPGMSHPTSLTYDERTWNYTPTSVTPPGGAPGWTFEYDTNSRLSVLTTPHGGEITYEYDTLSYEGPDPRQQKHLLEQKWPGDIQRQREQLDILKRLLEERF